MIYCPQCGTANKPNSKFCKNCAALLAPSTDVRCPICGTMNPAGAATCSNCGTRLTTTSATPSDRSTPADTPENITPFTPPDEAQATAEDASAPPAPPLTARRSFSRSSSEWLRRVQKTPPPEPSAGDATAATAAAASLASAPPVNAAPPVTAPMPAFSEVDDIPDWLREIQNEANRQAAEKNAPEISAAVGGETASEISTADQGETISDAHLAAAAGIAAADQLADRAAADVSDPSPVPLVETAAPAKPQLSEIKLTGDDYDYSDIGGEVTPEMQAELEAHADKLQSVDDETALARKLLGLDVEEAPTAAPEPETPNLAPLAAGAVAAQALTGDEPLAKPETSALPPAPTIETTGAPADDRSPIETSDAPADDRSHVPGIVAGVAAMGAAASELLGNPTPPPAATETPAPAKPQLSEIKLTGDDYDYSDIGGEVTPEMQAELEAHADKLQSVDDETALARKLLGLDVEEAPTAAPEPETPNLAPLAAGAVAAQALAKAEQPVLPPEATPVEAQAETKAELPVAEADVVVEQRNAPTQESDESPAWVAALAAASSAAIVAAGLTEERDKDDAVPELTPKEAGADVPPSLAVGATVAPLDAVPEGESDAPPTLESGEMPDWVREMAPDEVTGVKPPAPEEADALPGWVRELAPQAAALGTVAYLSELPELDEGERADLPDWLQESEPPAPESLPATAVADATATEGEGLAQEPPLELPSWFSDPAITTPARDPFEVVEMTGPLAGISGILPLALAITEPHRLTTPTPARSDGGRIFQTLLAEPLAATAPVEPQAARKKLFTTNHLLYLIILVAAIVPLFFGLEQAGLGLNATTSGTALFYDQLQSIPPNRAALLAFEYNPGGSVELDPAARAIVNDLAAKGVPVIAVTSNPNGAALAQNILERARETHPEFSFVNIGYIPGNEAGLRALASGWLPAGREDVNGAAWGSNPLAGQVRNMDDLALTVLVAGEDAPLRAWMEQVQPRVTSPIIAATSAMLEPQARNYVNANQLKASLRGLTGAAELELLSNQTGPAVKTMDAFSIVSLVLAGIIIVANVMLLLRRKQ